MTITFCRQKDILFADRHNTLYRKDFISDIYYIYIKVYFSKIWKYFIHSLLPTYHIR